MGAETAIVSLLIANATVNGLASGRIAPVSMPDGIARPNIVYQRVSTGRLMANDGPLGLARPTFQLSCYADDYPAARALADAVRGALNGYSGTVGGVKVQSIRLDDERDAPQPPATGQSRPIAGVVLVFVVAFNE